MPNKNANGICQAMIFLASKYIPPSKNPILIQACETEYRCYVDRSLPKDKLVLTSSSRVAPLNPSKFNKLKTTSLA